MPAALPLGKPRDGLLLQLDQLEVEVPHALDRLERPGPLPLWGILRIPVAEIDLEEVLHAHLPLLELRAHPEKLLDDGRGPEQSRADLALAGLDPLRDLDLPLPVEQRDPTHLAQIHANGIVVAHRMLKQL